MILMFGTVALVLAVVAIATFTESWPAIFAWFADLGTVGVFTVVLGFAAAFAVGGYLVIRRATPR